ncbi:MAG TPA: adenine phosphoribosyltransferase [Candidatus Gastranaerophilaceae bacterium]|nr:adenine phosphoribosyltransferase [Candidatus Gastranaerophilaceae bacterium]HPT41726.1 adenine phosphoribosyltransferase [Candidatus Gastranaerophilaceae bacterium]
MTQQVIEQVKDTIRSIKDFPKPGIMFRDITTALKDKQTLRLMVDFLCEQFKDEKIDYVVGMESRGFIFGMPVAYKLNAGFIPVRKPNKLPAKTIKETYELEYGTDALEIHEDALKKGDRVLILDDLLATGGTAAAACNLVTRTGAEIVGCGFVIELKALNGRAKLPKDVRIVSMVKY